MQDAVRSKKIEIIPKRFEKTYFHWIDNLRDWCISRQIWFGHQIPVWYKGEETYVGIEAPSGEGWEQDPDTLDTWFSSGLWTFSPLGWPNKTDDLKTYHPTSVMETGYDILFFWVARMILMSTYLMDEIPFKKVYMHGLVRDKKGRKMSKSLNNVIDPLDVIAKYGTDAIRLSLVIGSTPGNDVKLSEEKIASYRNFANKLWNIARYIITNYELENVNQEINEKKLTLADEWILDNMQKLIKEVTTDIDNFKFSQAGEKLKEFTWNNLADWYLEVSKFEKTEEKEKILIKILQNLLKLWHPFMPFVTEAIWNELEEKELLMVNSWPQASPTNSKGDDFEIIKDVITAVRQIKSESKIPPKEKIKAVIYAGDKVELIKSQTELIKSLRTGIEELEIKEGKDEIGEGKQFKVIIKH